MSPAPITIPMNFEQLRHEQNSSVLETPIVQRFIAMRKIEVADLPLIEALARIESDVLILGVKNFFPGNQEESADLLHKRAQDLNQGEAYRTLYTLFEEFTRKYSWRASYHLFGVLEQLHREGNHVRQDGAL